jgi:hypothetical protein
MPTPATTDTYRWDTVFAIRMADVNAAIRAAGTSPPTMAYTSPDGWQLTATFGTWQLTNQGDGRQVWLSLPLLAGSLTMDGKAHAFSNLSAAVSVELAYFDSTTADTSATGTFSDLRVNTTPRPGQPNVATVQGISFNGGPSSFLIDSLLPGALTGWLNDHLGLFGHVFATVNVGRYVASGAFAWAMPTTTDYAFSSHDPADDSLLAVLCMTENRPADGLLPQLSPWAIPAGQRAGYLVSNERFLQKLIHPALPYALPGLREADLTLSTDQQRLELANAAGVSLPVVHEGTTYDNVLEALTISLEATYLQVYFRTATSIGWGVTAHCESTHRYALTLQPKPNGKPTLTYATIGTPTVNHWTTQTNDPITTAIIIIVGAVLTTLLGVFTAGAGFVAGALVIGLLTGLAIEAPTIAATVGTDDAPDLDLLTLNTTDPIQWVGQDRFQLGSVAINGCVQLGGVFIPKP